jgi:hypothetical protein
MTVEDRIAQALHALADGAVAPAEGETRLASRLRREHQRRRIVALAGTVAVVVGVAGLTGTLRSRGSSSAPAPFATPSVAQASPEPSAVASKPESEATPESTPTSVVRYPAPASDVGGPARFLTVTGGGYAFHDARTGRLQQTGGVEGYQVVSAAALGDGRTFYVGSGRGKCGPVRFDQLTVVGSDVRSTRLSDVPGTAGLRGQIHSLAISRDGRQLAFSVTSAISPQYGSCTDDVVRVVNLRTGATRAWTGGDAAVSNLNWAPDGRTLLMHVTPCCGDNAPGVTRLDTRAPGTDYSTAPDIVGYTNPSSTCGPWLTASADAQVFAVEECGGAVDELRIVVLDPSTGRIGRRIATISGPRAASGWSFSVSPDGLHFLISADAYEVTNDYRVDNGRVSQLPTHLDSVVW